MQHANLRRRASVIALGAMTVATVSYAVTASGVSPSAPASECRASLVRVTLAGETLVEPFVANDSGAPCVAADGSLIGNVDNTGLPIDGTLPIDGNVLYAVTDTAHPQAKAGAVDLTVQLSALDPSLPDISAQVLKSEAGVACSTNGTPSLTSSSRVVGLQVGGEEVVVLPPDDASDPLEVDPLINIYPNEEVVEGTSITRRALRINALDGNVEVVIAESQAGYTGNPCTTATNGPTSGGPTSGGPTTAPPTSAPPTPTTGLPGWMNGGGTMVNEPGTTIVGATKVSHGFVLPCIKGQTPPGGTNLVVNWDLGSFKLDKASTAFENLCTNQTSEGAPEQPSAGFNQMEGSSTGTCNGEPATIEWRFTDEGEPNTADEADLRIDGEDPACDLTVVGILTNGNNQAHGDPANSSKGQPTKSPRPAKA